MKNSILIFTLFLGFSVNSVAQRNKENDTFLFQGKDSFTLAFLEFREKAKPYVLATFEIGNSKGNFLLQYVEEEDSIWFMFKDLDEPNPREKQTKVVVLFFDKPIFSGYFYIWKWDLREELDEETLRKAFKIFE